MKNKICLIGYGYWGKIIHKNLIELGYLKIKIIDDVLENSDEITDIYSDYFVVTPYSTHYDILSKLSKFKNKKIWCEKPLVELSQIDLIYKSMENNNNKLFVDWVYIFNPGIKKIKEIISNKKIIQIILNRTNDGPKRHDCSSIFDLSSHDISILYYLFGDKNFNIKWNEFSIKSNENNGSNISWCYNDGLQIIINSSWQHSNKNRMLFFITEDNETIMFNDVTKTIITKNETISVSEYSVNSDFKTPIQVALEYFFASVNFDENEKLTHRITNTITTYD